MLGAAYNEGPFAKRYTWLGRLLGLEHLGVSCSTDSFRPSGRSSSFLFEILFSIGTIKNVFGAKKRVGHACICPNSGGVK